MKHKRIGSWIIAGLLVFAVSAMLVAPRTSLAQRSFPTRTPKPEGQPTNPPPKPTSDNGGGGGGGGQPQPTDPPPAATEAPPTAVPALPTATEFALVPPAASPTPPQAAVLTPVFVFPGNATPFPTAEACGLPPTVQIVAASSIHAGPASAYEIVALLGLGEVRPIAGRAAFAPWWVVQLDGSGRIGWVPDAAVQVQGDTGRVAIFSAPDLNGVAPSPGTAWVPTPNPDCAAPPAVAAQAATPEAAAEVQGTGSVAGANVPPSNLPVLDSSTVAAAGAEQSESGPLAAALADGQPLDTGSENSAKRAQGDPQAEAALLVAELAGAAEPLESAPASAAANYLPLGGILLIVAAVILGLYLRRSSSLRQE